MKPSCSAIATNDRLQVRLAVWGTLARLAVARDVEVLAAISVDCQPIVNVVGIRVATATIECQMVGGMLGQAPVADEFCWQAIVARVGADTHSGKRRRRE